MEGMGYRPDDAVNFRSSPEPQTQTLSARDLLEKQRQFKENKLKEQDEAAAKATLSAQNETAVEGSKQQREALLSRLNDAQTEIAELESGGIKERLEQAEKYKPYQEQLQANLASAEAHMEQTQAFLAEAEEGLGSEAELAPDVAQILAQSRQEVRTIELNITHLNQQLEEVAGLMVSNDEAERYAALQAERADLSRQIEGVEQNPDVVESLHNDALVQNEHEKSFELQDIAEQENALRTEIITKAIETGLGRPEDLQPELKQILEQLGQGFISEEFAAKGIHGEKNLKVQAEKMNEFGKDMLTGLSTKDEQDIKSAMHYTGRDILAGLALRTLMRGDPYQTLTYSSRVFHPRGGRDTIGGLEEIKLRSEAMGRHLGTFNQLRAYQGELKAGQASEIFTKDWQQFDSNANNTGQGNEFHAITGGPIVPRNATRDVQEQLTTDFQTMRESARNLNADLENGNREALEQELHTLEQARSEVEGVIAAHDALPKDEDFRNVETNRQYVSEQLTALRGQLAAKEAIIQNPGLADRLKLGNHRREAEAIRSTIQEHEASLQEHDDYLKSTEAAREPFNNDPFLRRDADARLGQIQRQIQAVNERLNPN